LISVIQHTEDVNVKSSYVIVLSTIISLFVFWALPATAGDDEKLKLDIDGGKNLDFVSYSWGDGSTGVPDAAAVADHQIRSLTIKRKPDENSKMLLESKDSGDNIPSMSLKVSDSMTVQMHNVTVVNIADGGATTEKAGATEVVKFGFEKLMIPAGS
jgi:hypothetical protein